MKRSSACGLVLLATACSMGCGGQDTSRQDERPLGAVDAGPPADVGAQDPDVAAADAADVAAADAADVAAADARTMDDSAAAAEAGGAEDGGPIVTDGAGPGDAEADAVSDSTGSDEDSGPIVRPGTDQPSCAGLEAICGAGHDESCCTSRLVPGGTFKRSYDGVEFMDPSAPATVGDFFLDRFEVTIGRFRRFVAAYALPSTGAGKNPRNAGDPGWDAAWNTDGSMPLDAAALANSLKCNAVYQTWTDTAGDNEDQPVACVSWHEAAAFCIWDGGRLPTEAEWNYAASGGDEQRYYPWSIPATSTKIDATYATCKVATGTSPVGATPKGDARWGHADMGGNVWEWVLDTSGAYPVPCVDCANLTVSTKRRMRGGSFYTYYAAEGYLVTGTRQSGPPLSPRMDLGMRCARTP